MPRPATETRNSARRGRRFSAATAFVVVVAAQIALPLASEAEEALVTVTVAALAVATVLIASFRWKPEKLLIAAVVTFVATLALEALGSTTGFPFGAYSYSDALQPQLLGVPLIVPLAWVAMGIPALEIGRRAHPKPFVQALGGGFALTVWDLFLDPLMVGFGYWSWKGGGPAWEGIPLSNYLGWLVAGTFICALLARLLPLRPTEPSLIGLYLWMVGFSALGFLIPIAFDRPVVGITGLICATPLLFFAFRRTERSWLAS